MLNIAESAVQYAGVSAGNSGASDISQSAASLKTDKVLKGETGGFGKSLNDFIKKAGSADSSGQAKSNSRTGAPDNSSGDNAVNKDKSKNKDAKDRGAGTVGNKHYINLADNSAGIPVDIAKKDNSQKDASVKKAGSADSSGQAKSNSRTGAPDNSSGDNAVNKDKSKNKDAKDRGAGTVGQISTSTSNGNAGNIIQPFFAINENNSVGKVATVNAASGDEKPGSAITSRDNTVLSVADGNISENASSKIPDSNAEHSALKNNAAANENSNSLNSEMKKALKNIENQTDNSRAAENKDAVNADISANAGANKLIKDALSNAFNLTALKAEEKSFIPESDTKNTVNAVGNGLLSSDSLKISSTIDVGYSVVAGTGISGQTSNGNSGGLNLQGGGVAGADESDSGHPASTALNSIMLMVKRNVQTATLTLTPASLGSVKINISVNNLNNSNSLNSPVSIGSITINMLAQNEIAKNILSSSSESLQNALKNQGFSSINLNISSGSGYNNQTGNNGNEQPKNPFSNSRYGGNSFGGGPSGSVSISHELNISAYRNSNALIDYFV